MKWLATSLILTILCFATTVLAQQPRPVSKASPQREVPSEAPKEAAPTNEVEGLSLPAPQEVDPKEKYVVVQAKIDPDYKLQSLDWIVVSMSQEPLKYTELDTAVIVAVPSPGEAVLLYADALLYKEVENQIDVEVDIEGKPTKQKVNVTQKEYKKTKWVTTVVGVKGAPVKPGGGSTPGTPSTSPGQPIAIPPSVGRLHVVVVLDNVAGDPRQKSLYETTSWKETLRKGGHLPYVYDAVKDDQLLQLKGLKKLMVDAGGGSVLIVMTADGRPLPTGTAIKLPITDDPARNELIVLDLAGRAAGGR
jgi:hypothetical protein